MGTSNRKFVNGDYTVVKKLTVIPGYHFIIASIAKPLGIDTLNGYRAINFFLILLTLIPIFFILTKFNIMRTVQFFFFPLMFMFYFLVYTDLFSLLLILLSFLLMRQKKYITSGIIATLSMFVRQNNLFWVGFIMLWVFIEDVQKNKTFKINIIILFSFIKRLWMHIFGILIFLGYILYKGRIVMDDNMQHPISFHMGNIWFFLFLFFIAFFPIILQRFDDIIKYFKQKKRYLLLLIGVFFIGAGSYVNTHFYNHIEGIWFNIVLNQVTEVFLLRLCFFVIITISVAYLLFYKFDNKLKYLIYPFTILYLGLSWLVEPRYYYIPFAFFMIFRKEEKRWIEWFILIFYIFISVLFFSTLLKS